METLHTEKYSIHEKLLLKILANPRPPAGSPAANLGTLSLKKNGKKRGHCPLGGGGGQPQFLFKAQIYRILKSLRNGLLTTQYGQIWPNMDQIWTFDTTIWPNMDQIWTIDTTIWPNMDYWHHNMAKYRPNMDQIRTFDTTIWPNMAKIVILRAFNIKMSRVPFTHFCR